MQTINRSYEDLRQALRKRLEIIADTAFRDRDPHAHLAALREVSTQIENSVEQLEPPPATDLRHYLHIRSFNKALDCIENRKAGCD